ncbi:MAG: class I SAM-dependent methyltransferase [Crocinitomicaceae bacterium]
MDNITKEKHWDKAYNARAVEDLGWYEKTPQPSLDLIRSLNLSPYAEILTVGAGATTLIEHLLEDGYQNITINDISAVALDRLRDILGKEECNVEWMKDDLTQPTLLKELPMLDLWHDRAVLHFFTDARDQLTYFNLLKQKVKSKGYVILATFAKGGAEKCCNLPIVQYDIRMMAEHLGNDFELLKELDYTFINPRGGERPYKYAVFQRK